MPPTRIQPTLASSPTGSRVVVQSWSGSPRRKLGQALDLDAQLSGAPKIEAELCRGLKAMSEVPLELQAEAQTDAEAHAKTASQAKAGQSDSQSPFQRGASLRVPEKKQFE